MKRLDHRSRRSWATVALAGVGLALLASPLAWHPLPRLVWNASASAPLGLYSVTPIVPISAGDMVIARVPERWRKLAATRKYIPVNVPLVKRVVGIPGDQICALDGDIFLNGEALVQRRRIDGAGRPMPWWQGCQRLVQSQYFLLMVDKDTSFDGRYFGPSSAGDIVGRARLLWAQ